MVVTHTIVASSPKHDPGRDLQKKHESFDRRGVCLKLIF
jgi:hypothetical protein